MDRNETLKEIRAKKFVRNNGIVLRSINLLRHEYIQLETVWLACERDMGEQEFLDCVNYLQEKEYIRIRSIQSKEVLEIADAHYSTLEAKVTHQGIALLGGATKDSMVNV